MYNLDDTLRKKCHIIYMIHSLTVENFFSIQEAQSVFFEIPDNAPNLPNFIQSRIANKRLPTVVGLFGANASGKSTVLRAIVSAATFVLYSFNLGVEAQIPFFQPYMSKANWDKPSKIKIEFDAAFGESEGNSIFRYELHIDHDASRFGKAVAYEALFHAPNGKYKRLFERKYQSIKFGKEFRISENDPRTQTVRSNASVIQTLAQYNHSPSIQFIHLVSGLKTNSFGFDKIQRDQYEFLSFYAQNSDYLERLNKKLKRLDVGLEEMQILQSPQGPVATFKHVGLDDYITLPEESTGTRRFIQIFPMLEHALDTGSIVLIDELDADLHPLLIPEIFNWFNDPEHNKYKAQLFFTAHNSSLLDELEKEQILLTEKTAGRFTTIYNAKNIKGLRRQPSLMKKYLSGELGAVPYIG